jgi:hypothetical protein
MQVIKAVTSQKFGVPFSIGLAGFAWLTFTTLTGCWTTDYDGGHTGPTERCVTKSLMTSLIDDKMWPLQYAPFTAYWDSYDDKFAWLMSELYFRLILFGIVIYGIWFALSYFARRRYGRMTVERQY